MANRKRLSSVVLWGLSATLLSLSIWSAQAQEQPTADSKKKAEDQLIKCSLGYVATVQVEVWDKDGKEVTDLGKDDFVLYEDGVRQEMCFWKRNVGSDRQTDEPLYEAGYYPMNNQFEGEYRKIRVLVRSKDQRKLKVQFTPKGYYAKKELRK